VNIKIGKIDEEFSKYFKFQKNKDKLNIILKNFFLILKTFMNYRKKNNIESFVSLFFLEIEINIKQAPCRLFFLP